MVTLFEDVASIFHDLILKRNPGKKKKKTQFSTWLPVLILMRTLVNNSKTMTFENIKLNLAQGYISKQFQLLKANYK